MYYSFGPAAHACMMPHMNKTVVDNLIIDILKDRGAIVVNQQYNYMGQQAHQHEYQTVSSTVSEDSSFCEE